jgi:hypothetical protein
MEEEDKKVSANGPPRKEIYGVATWALMGHMIGLFKGTVTLPTSATNAEITKLSAITTHKILFS